MKQHEYVFYDGLKAKEELKLELAKTKFKKAFELNNNYAEAHHEYGMLLLQKGDYEQGWEQYEWRLKTKKEIHNYPYWNGKDFTEDYLLITCEQGLGDFILFSRFIKILISKTNMKIILEVPTNVYQNWEPKKDVLLDPPSLKNVVDDLILSSYKDRITIVIKGYTDIKQYNIKYQISLLSLPKLFKLTLNNIPNPIKINTNKGFKSKYPAVGLSWKGSPTHNNDENRSIPNWVIETFIGKFPNINFYNLQLNTYIKSKNNNITNFHIIDIKDTINAIQNMDLVIAVDSFICHLSGSCNIPTFMLAPYNIDWRWIERNHKCLWYPNTTIIHSDTPKDWKNQFNIIQYKLENIFI